MTSLHDLRAFYALAQERARQDTKWGQQDHDDFVWQAILTEEVGEAAQAALKGSSYHQLEARTRSMADLAAEVTQTGAVAVSWLGALARRAGPRRERVYIAGPIAGLTDARAQFDAAEAELTARGLEPVSPWKVAPLTHADGDCPPGYSPGEDAGKHTSSACFMRTDLFALLSCDAIYLLPGWRNSRGATVEHAVATACGMRIEEAPQP